MNTVIHDVAELVATHMLQQHQFGEGQAQFDQEWWEAEFTLRGRRPFRIRVWCDPQLANAAARRFFGDDGRPLTEAELRDAVGEIGNVIAGNLKAVITGDDGGPTTLSLPTVSARATPARFAQYFTCENGYFAVHVEGEGSPQ